MNCPTGRYRRFRISGRIRLFLPLVCLTPILFEPLSAQTFYFGQNKIQYVDFDWHLLKGEHIDIYFYPDEQEIAEIALEEAEASYLYLEEKLRHHVFRRIPLILYSSHQDFEQTNIIPYFVPEGVGGVTEFLKGRVALPFNGSYHDFKAVIRHEMVHVFELSMLSRAQRMNHKMQVVYPPLWLTEGLAEHLSDRWDTLGDQVMRDLVLHNRLTDIKDLWRYNGTFALYKIGQSIMEYLGERFGDERIGLLYEELGRGKTFSEALHRTYGISLEELSREWNWAMKTRYYPEVKELTDLTVLATRLTDEGANFHPVVLDRGDEDEFVYVSTRTGYVDICARPLDESREGERVVLKGGREALFESLHPFASEIDVNGSGLLAFSSKYHDRDALILFDVKKEEIVDRYQFPDIVGITSPAWSPDEDRVVFSGLTSSGYLDLYILHLREGRLERLTNDRFSDLSPDFSPSGDRIVFSSDRSPCGKEGCANLYILDLESREITCLTLGPWRDESPVWDGGSRAGILFVSDREGVRSAYEIREGETGRRLTAFASGMYSPRWLPEARGIIFTAMRDQDFSIYKYDLEGEADSLEFVSKEEIRKPSWDWEIPGGRVDRVEEIEEYRRKFSLDIAQGGVGFSSSFGNSQGASLVMTDMLSDQLISFQVYNTASSTSDFFSSFSGSVAYLNRKERLNYGYGAYHFKGDFFDLRHSDSPFSERQYGGFFLLGYPFSRFLRVETSVLLSRSQREDFITDFNRNSYLVTNLFSLVRDNSLWLPTGPIDGERFNITVGITNDLTRAQSDNTTLLVDLRKYFRTSLRTAYAVRFIGRISEGSLPERSFIGGSWTLRGYPRFSILGTRVVLLNQELRFPLLRNLIFRFPFGDFAFPPFQGALFFDVGNAWDGDDGYPGMLGSFGLGVRFSLGGPLVLRMDFARTTDFDSISNDTKFDFFFGYNY